MPDITDLLIKERLQALTPDYRDFVLGDMPSATVSTYAVLLSLDEERRSVLENGYTMYLLLFLSKYELMEFIATECSVPAYAAVTCVSSILESTPVDIKTSIETAYKKMNASADLIRRNSVLESLNNDKTTDYIKLRVESFNKAKSLELDETISLKIAEFCGDIYLGIYKPTDFIPFLYHNLKIISSDVQNKIEDSLFDFIYNNSQEALLSNSITSSLTSEISATEHEIASLQAVRTMSHDMAVIKPGSDVVYQASSQADILERDVVVREDVVSAAPQANRWDTES